MKRLISLLVLAVLPVGMTVVATWAAASPDYATATGTIAVVQTDVSGDIEVLVVGQDENWSKSVTLGELQIEYSVPQVREIAVRNTGNYSSSNDTRLYDLYREDVSGQTVDSNVMVKVVQNDTYQNKTLYDGTLLGFTVDNVESMVVGYVEDSHVTLTYSLAKAQEEVAVFSYQLKLKEVQNLLKVNTQVSNTDNVGHWTSVAIGTDGYPVISYRNVTDGDLMIHKCSNASCTSGSSTQVADAGRVGYWTSIAIGADSYPVISYAKIDYGENDLMVYKCSNASCSSGSSTQIVGTEDVVGNFTSIVVGTDGYPVISYQNATDGDLMVYKCSNASCSSGSSTQITDADVVGQYTSMVIGTDGYPVISYYNATDGDLMVYKCSNASCSSGSSVQITDADVVGQYTSIAVGTDSYPVISYYNSTDSNLMVYKCSNISCSSGSSVQITDASLIGAYSSMKIGTDGYPVISGLNSPNLMVYKCNNASCSSGSKASITSTDNIGTYTSIAIGVDGYPVVAHYNSTDGDLMILKCVDESCTN